MIHGGNVWQGNSPADWLDYSANIRPEGAPEWVKEAIMGAMDKVSYYPAATTDILEEISFDSEKLTDIIRRKYLSKMTDEKGRKKAVDALIRLGYSYGEIRDALKEIDDEIICEVYDE